MYINFDFSCFASLLYFIFVLILKFSTTISRASGIVSREILYTFYASNSLSSLNLGKCNIAPVFHLDSLFVNRGFSAFYFHREYYSL